MKKITLKDIAQRAEVSISTVSRVINQSQPNAASAEVQEKIWKIVRETNYKPNLAARQLKLNQDEHASDDRQKTGTVACFFPRTSEKEKNLFFNEIARAFEQEIFKHGYLMKFSIFSEEFQNQDFQKLLLQENVLGVAVIGRASLNMMEFLKKKYKYVVYTSLNQLNGVYDQVICDGKAAAWKAVDYLAKNGHQRIAYLGEIHDEVRYNGYRQRMATMVRGEEMTALTYDCQLSYNGGYCKMKKILQTNTSLPFSAIFCGNDSTAIGAIKALREFDLNVPKDISIISIDDIETAQYVSPMLTTFRIPLHHLGKITGRMLIERIENGNDLPLTITLPFDLVVRESCRKITTPWQ